MDDRDDITQLIEAARVGDVDERHVLFERVLSELRTIASSRLRRGPRLDRTGTTGLVNQLFIELERRFPPPPRDQPESRVTFYRSASLAMRTILRDTWRRRTAQCRGGGAEPVALPAERALAHPSSDTVFDAADYLALDDALTELERRHPRWYGVVELRFFGHRTVDQTAELLGVSDRTVKTDWQLARAWLQERLDP